MTAKSRKRYRYSFVSLMVAFLLVISLSAAVNLGVKSTADSVLTTIIVPLPSVSYGPAINNQIVVNHATNMVYVLDSWGVGMTNEENVTVINGTSNQVTATIGSFYAEDTDAIAVNPTTNQVFVNTRWVTYVIDGSNNSVTQTLTSNFSLFFVPYGLIAVNPVTDMLYRSAPSLEVFNVATGSLVAALNIGGCQILGMAVNSVTDMVYVIGTCGSNNSYYAVINGATNTVVRNMTSIPVSTLSGGIAVDQGTNLVYITGGEINGTTNNFVSDNRFNITESVAVNSNTNLIYVTDGQYGLNIYNASSGALVQKLTVEYGPHYLALDEITGRTYVSNGGSGTVSVIGGAAATSSSSTTSTSSTSSSSSHSTTSTFEDSTNSITQTSSASSTSTVSISSTTSNSTQLIADSSSSTSTQPLAPPPPSNNNSNSNYEIMIAAIIAIVVVVVGAGSFAVIRWSGRELF